MKADASFFRAIGNRKGGQAKLAIDALLDEVERLQTKAAAERAAAATWLRVQCGAYYFADAIERGEHRAGEAPRG